MRKIRSSGTRGTRVTPALRRRAAAIIKAMHAARPAPRVELLHSGPFQLLIATILSAQCTDARVNQVTRDLFRAHPDAASLARVPQADLERAIRSTGFFRSKAKSIRGCSAALVERHQGNVPKTMEEMLRLPGVGRKTANVVLGAGYGIPSGIVVDTHMTRVAQRLGLTKRSDPEGIERDLMALIPPEEWIYFSIAMILHGRYVCVARRPRCSACPLNPHCPSRHLEAEGPAGGRSRRPSRGRTGSRRARPRASPDAAGASRGAAAGSRG